MAKPQETSASPATARDTHPISSRAVPIAVLMSIIGFSLLIVSLMLNIAAVEFSGNFQAAPLQDTHIDIGDLTKKQVGYAAAPNWSFYGIIFMPVMIAYGLGMVRNMEPTLQSLADRKMVRDKNLNPIESGTLIGLWRKLDWIWWLILGITAMLSIAFIAYDGWKVVTDPIQNPGVLAGKTLQDTAYEFDWSISCLYKDSDVNCRALSIFASFAYALVPGVSTVFAFAIAITALRFMAFIKEAGRDSGQWMITIDPKWPDDKNKKPLFGWDAFEGFFSKLLIWAIWVQFGLWLMIVQNAYLRDVHHDNIFEFIFQDAKLGAGWIIQPQTVFTQIASGNLDTLAASIWHWIWVEPSSFMFANWQFLTGVLVFSFVSALAFFGSWLLLRSIAEKSKAYAIDNSTIFAREAGVEPEAFAMRVKKMEVWPVAWMGQMRLFGLMFLLCASLFSYRIVLVAIALIAVVVVSTAVASIGKEIADRIKEFMDRF